MKQFSWLTVDQTHDAGVTMKSKTNTLPRGGMNSEEWDHFLAQYLSATNQWLFNTKKKATLSILPARPIDHFLAEDVDFIRDEINTLNQDKNDKLNADSIFFGRKYVVAFRNAAFTRQTINEKEIEFIVSRHFLLWTELPQYRRWILPYSQKHKTTERTKAPKHFLHHNPSVQIEKVYLKTSEWVTLYLPQGFCGDFYQCESWVALVLQLPMGDCNKSPNSVSCNNYKDGSMKQQKQWPSYIYTSQEVKEEQLDNKMVENLRKAQIKQVQTFISLHK